MGMNATILTNLDEIRCLNGSMGCASHFCIITGKRPGQATCSTCGCHARYREAIPKALHAGRLTEQALRVAVEMLKKQGVQTLEETFSGIKSKGFVPDLLCQGTLQQITEILNRKD